MIRAQDPLLDRIADTLEELHREVEALGAQLCSDPAVITAHFTALQGLDRIAQQQRALAEVLRARDPEAAADAVTLDLLRTRLLGHL